VSVINLIQVGVGLIGRTTIEQVLDNRERWRETLGIEVHYRGLIELEGGTACEDPGGYSDATLRGVCEARASRRAMPDIAAEFGLTIRDPRDVIERVTRLGPTIVLDTAVGDRTAEIDAFALERGAGLALSNKAPLAMPAGAVGDALWACAGPRGRVRYETTCGAGLPVISTLRSLLDTGDQVIEIVGALSGTLGAIFSDVAAGKPFSAAVRSAKERGYTEPDPRDDLSGLDVARKALILARTLGRRIDLAEISVENLVPEELRSVSVAEFLDRASESDPAMAARAEEARAEGKVLKYVATVRPDEPISVGVRAVASNTVLGALQGPENIITFRTSRYDDYPLTVTGPGAGAAVTAAGVVADMLALATGPLAE